MKVMVETSAHHVHVSEADLATLFGPGATLTNKKDLSQPGQFACAEKVEISLTDARKLGVTAPIRESGDLEGTPGCTLKGPAGEVAIEKGVIAAKRHIHFNPDEAKEAGVTDKQIVSVKVDYNGRSLTFGDVVCRVSPSYALAMHVDTDESNAAALPGTVDGEIIL